MTNQTELFPGALISTSKLITAVKAVRDTYGMGLNEAKEYAMQAFPAASPFKPAPHYVDYPGNDNGIDDETQCRIDDLEEAKELLCRAIELIRDAVDGSAVYQTADAYLIPTLEQAMSDDNQWVGGHNPGNIQNLIDRLQDENDVD